MIYSASMAAVGALLGFLSGLFGVGGSSVATPVLRLLDVPRLIALGTPLPVTLPTALVGGFTYWKRGLVNLRTVLGTAAGGVPAVIAGSYLTEKVPGRILMILTGFFVAAVGLRLLRPVAVARGGEEKRTPPPRALIAVGVGIGFLSGLLANGGGFLLVPAYMLLFAMEAQEAAATSLVTVAFLALPGTWVHWHLHHIDWQLALFLSLGVLPSTYLGARVSLLLDKKRARLVFGLFLFFFGLFFLGRTLYRAETYGWLQ